MENPQEPSLNAKGEKPQEPSQDSQGKNTHEPSPSTQTVSIHIDEKFVRSDWYAGIVHFLIHFECPSEFSKIQCKTLKLKSIKYCIINAKLY